VLNPTAEKITGNVMFSKSVLGRDTSTVTDLLTGAAVASGNKAGFDLGAYGVKFLIVK
jgi:D-alanyl-D-alanine carboxypeptidase